MSRAPARVGMAPPHPGAFIRDEILDELGLTVSEAATAVEVRRATLSDLINGNAALSAEMALRIEKAFGVKMAAARGPPSHFSRLHAMRHKYSPGNWSGLNYSSAPRSCSSHSITVNFTS
jgi:addiction module HigA family antidote